MHRLMQKPRDLSPFQKEIACGKGRVVERERKTEGVWFYIAYGRFIVVYLKSRGIVSRGRPGGERDCRSSLPALNRKMSGLFLSSAFFNHLMAYLNL